MKKVFRTADYMEAQIVNALLQNEGFAVESNGDFLVGGLGELPAADVYILRIPENQYTQAAKLIKDYQEGNLVFDFEDDETHNQ